MKKVFLLAFLILLTATFATSAFAAKNFQRNETVLLSKDDVVEGDYFAAGERVTIAGTVNGDAYVAGGNVIVGGHYAADLIAGGGTFIPSASLSVTIRVGGGQIVI